MPGNLKFKLSRQKNSHGSLPDANTNESWLSINSTSIDSHRFFRISLNGFTFDGSLGKRPETNTLRPLPFRFRYSIRDIYFSLNELAVILPLILLPPTCSTMLLYLVKSFINASFIVSIFADL